MAKKVLITLASGFEETEYVAVRDILIRKGFDVDSVSLTGDKLVRANHNLRMYADYVFDNVKDYLDDYAALFIPGGLLGVNSLDKSLDFDTILNDFVSRNAYIGAICAASSLLAKRNLLNKKEAVVFPTKKLIKILTDNGAIYLPNTKFVAADNFFTGDTMTSSIEFAEEFALFIK